MACRIVLHQMLGRLYRTPIIVGTGPQLLNKYPCLHDQFYRRKVTKASTPDPWEPYAKSYPVHEESRRFTDALIKQGFKPFHQYTLQEARVAAPKMFKLGAGEVKFDGKVKELVVPSKYAASGIQVSVYKPNNCVPKPAIWVYLHGGGLSVLDRKSYEPALQVIAMQAKCVIVNVEYRLLPDQGEPHCPFNDCFLATKWVMQNKEAVGGHPQSKVGVGGDSAGGQLSATMTNDITGLDFQILIYGNVDMSLGTPGVEEFANVPGLSKADILWFHQFIKKAMPGYINDVRFNPMVRTNTAQSPPALIIQAQLDSIRDSGLIYADKLKAAGVKVKVVMIEGVPHCYFALPAMFKTKLTKPIDPWEPYAKSYPIHEESRRFTDALIKQGFKPFHQYTLQEARVAAPKMFKLGAGEVKFDGKVKELVVPSKYAASGIQVSVYKPNNCVPKPAIWVYLHGGGLSILDRKSYEPALQVIAMQAKCVIVNVEYRLLPDQGEPHCPFNDCFLATKWVMQNKEAVGGHPQSKVGVGGDSAGGQLSATMTNDITGLDFQILIYGNVDMSLGTPGVEEFANVPGLSKADILWFHQFIKKAMPGYINDVRFNPMVRTNTAQSPPALIIQAQLDSIRDSGLIYADKLKAAGVKVNVVMIEGVPHCFFALPAMFKTKCKETYGHISRFINEFQ